MRRVHKIATVILALAGLCSAQNAASGEQEMIRLLAQQVKELQEKVTALEVRSGHSAPSSAEVPPQHQEEPSEAAPATDLLPHELEGIQWRGFAEANYKVLDQRQPEIATFGFMPGSAGNFYSGDFDLLLTSRINDKASFLAEIVFGEGDGQSFNVDLDRLLMKYNLQRSPQDISGQVSHRDWLLQRCIPQRHVAANYRRSSTCYGPFQ